MFNFQLCIILYVRLFWLSNFLFSEFYVLSASLQHIVFFFFVSIEFNLSEVLNLLWYIICISESIEALICCSQKSYLKKKLLLFNKCLLYFIQNLLEGNKDFLGEKRGIYINSFFNIVALRAGIRMPKVKTNRVQNPEGWELIEPTLRELQAKMREGGLSSH